MQSRLVKALLTATLLMAGTSTVLAQNTSPQQQQAVNPFAMWPGMTSPQAMSGAIPGAPMVQPGMGNPFMPFMNPANWTNPYLYSQFMYPGTYMAMMNPNTYMPFMNPMTYMPMMNPMAYMNFMNPAAYMQWMDPAVYTHIMNQTMSQYGMAMPQGAAPQPGASAPAAPQYGAPQGGQTPQAHGDAWSKWMKMFEQPQQQAAQPEQKAK